MSVMKCIRTPIVIGMNAGAHIDSMPVIIGSIMLCVIFLCVFPKLAPSIDSIASKSGITPPISISSGSCFIRYAAISAIPAWPANIIILSNS